jgi:hypothetical protein
VQQFFDDVSVLDSDNNLMPLASASITVYETGTANLATIYSDNGITPLANPFTGEDDGSFSFYAADGRYDVLVHKSPYRPVKITDILLEDPSSSKLLSIASSISDGDLTHSPDGNSVFDALALKAPLANPVFTGKVGIATSSPSAKLHISADEEEMFITSASGDVYGANWLQYRSRGTNASPSIVQSGDIIGGVLAVAYDGGTYRNLGRVAFYVDGEPGSGDMPGKIVFMTTPDGSVTEQVRMTIKNSGDVGIGTATPLSKLSINGGLHVGGDSDAGDNNALIDGTLGVTGISSLSTINLTGGQIAFPASQSASADANTLDDYEEGTWTPEIEVNGGTGTQPTSASQAGRYTKIGNKVFIECYLSASGTSLAAGNVAIKNLPFTILNASPRASFVVGYHQRITYGDTLALSGDVNTTKIVLYKSTSGGIAAIIQTTDCDFATGSGMGLAVSGFYTTT